MMLGMSKESTLDPNVPPGLEQKPRRFRVRPHSFGFKPGVDFDRLNQLFDEVEPAPMPDSTEIVRFARGGLADGILARSCPCP